jgi:hypothetical protein
MDQILVREISGFSRSLQNVVWYEEGLRDEQTEPSGEIVQSLWRHDRQNSPRGAGVGTYSVLQRGVPSHGFSAGSDRRRKLN